MRRYLRSIAVLSVAAAALAAAGCSSGDKSTDKSATPAKVTKITYLTAFGAVGRDAFVWVAKDKGYFKDAGIDIDIQLGAATDTNLKALAAGQAQFAAGRPERRGRHRRATAATPTCARSPRSTSRPSSRSSRWTAPA